MHEKDLIPDLTEIEESAQEAEEHKAVEEVAAWMDAVIGSLLLDS